MKPVVLTPKQWKAVRADLHTQYPKSVFALRDKMRAVLGFTVREHQAWIENKNYKKDWSEWSLNNESPSDILWSFSEPYKGHTETQIHLDFYSEKKRTMFLLKYSDFIIKAEHEKL